MGTLEGIELLVRTGDKIQASYVSGARQTPPEAPPSHPPQSAEGWSTVPWPGIHECAVCVPPESPWRSLMKCELAKSSLALAEVCL